MAVLIDAARDFLELLRVKTPADSGELADLWEGFHRERYPELYRKQTEDYATLGRDWREIARERVLPGLLQFLPAIEATRRKLPAIWERMMNRAEEVLGFHGEVLAVVHVGIGCGAGWATTYAGRPACLFGLEAIAELGWHVPGRLEGLVAHELGHIIHGFWRGEDIEPLEGKPAGLLYTEGFAQRLEHLVLGRDSFHQATAGDWVERCLKLLPGIARAYLARLQDDDVREFFGSWLDFRGIKYTGYFLGYRLILCLEVGRSLREIAVLSPEEIEEAVRAFLQEVSEKRR